MRRAKGLLCEKKVVPPCVPRAVVQTTSLLHQEGSRQPLHMGPLFRDVAALSRKPFGARPEQSVPNHRNTVPPPILQGSEHSPPPRDAVEPQRWNEHMLWNKKACYHWPVLNLRGASEPPSAKPGQYCFLYRIDGRSKMHQNT